MFVKKYEKSSTFFFLNKKSRKLTLNKYFIIIGVRIEILNNVCREVWKKIERNKYIHIYNTGVYQVCRVSRESDPPFESFS